MSRILSAITEVDNSNYIGVAEAQDLEEAFDQPYKLKWYPGDMDEVTAYAEIPNGDDLSIMFNLDANEEGEEAWSVEFYRNDSQEVTGEGDAQRIFATVLSAIQTFIKKYKPNRVIFSASKDNWAKQQQGSYSRVNLYDRLVQRYAKALGFKAFRADAGNKVHYELNRINKGVAEGLINEKIAEGIVYATGPRSHGINDVDLIFKNLRTKKIVASVLGNNDHGGIYEIKIDQNGITRQSPMFLATGNPQDDSHEHAIYKLSSTTGNNAKEFSTMRNGFDTKNNTYYGMNMEFIGDDDYWSFLENMIGDIMWEDDAIEAGYVDRLDNGDLVFMKNQGVAEGDSGAKYRIKQIGKDNKGDYYISPSTGKKVYKQAKVGDHENPKTGEHMKKIKEDETLQFAAEVTPKVSPYAGVKDNKFRGAIGEESNYNPVGVQPSGWRKYKLKVNELKELGKDKKEKIAKFRQQIKDLKNKGFYKAADDVQKGFKTVFPGEKIVAETYEYLLYRYSDLLDKHDDSFVLDTIINESKHEDKKVNAKKVIKKLENTSEGQIYSTGGGAGQSQRKYKPKLSGVFEGIVKADQSISR